MSNLCDALAMQRNRSSASDLTCRAILFLQELRAGGSVCDAGKVQQLIEAALEQASHARIQVSWRLVALLAAVAASCG